MQTLFENQKIGAKLVSWSITSVESLTTPPEYDSQVTFGVGMPACYLGDLTSNAIVSGSAYWDLNLTGIYYNFESANVTD